MTQEYSSPALIKAVDRLCKPRRHTLIQPVMGHWEELIEHNPEDPDADLVQIGQRRTTITETSLLHQLEEHISASLNGSGGSTLASQRMIFNANILQIWIDMSSTLRLWRAMDLNYSGFTRNSTEFEASLREYTRVMLYVGAEEWTFNSRAQVINQWCVQIYAALNPQRERVLPDTQCPECQSWDFWVEGEQFRHPLVVKYFSDHPKLIETATGHCRACGTEWTAEGLAYALDWAAGGGHLTQRVADVLGPNFVL